jgi:hypothetical protein
MIARRTAVLLLCSLLVELGMRSSAYQPSVDIGSKHRSPTKPAVRAATAAATAALSVLLSANVVFMPPAAVASDTAAQISLDRLPPTSISLQIGDLPVVGSLLSGTYTKVPDGSIASPSITIKSPKDKVKAISSIATGGHLEFDVGGKLSTHLDVDIAADEPGVAKIVIKSPLVPKLPFKNMASSMIGQPTGGRESQWNIVTNLGSGESYYYNVKTGVTQLGRPDKI